MVQNNFKRAFGGWHISREFYGDAILAEATFLPQKENYYLGVGLNIGFEGTYQLRISDKTLQATGKYTLFLAKWTTSLVILTQTSVAPEDVDIQNKASITLRIECKDGFLRGYLNNLLILTYDDSSAKHKFLTGYCGVWIHPEKAAVIEDFRCLGTQKETPQKPERPVTDKGYVMCLKDADVNGKLPYWSSEPYQDEWCVEEECYRSPKGCSNSMTHLHVFESNPHINMEISFDSSQKGIGGVLLRHAPKTAYVKVGYDCNAKRWFIEDVPALYDCQIKRFESEIFQMESGRVYCLEIEADSTKVILSVDKTILIEAEDVKQTGFGRIGLFTDDLNMNVLAFSADIPYATDIIDGVIKTFVDENHIGASTELEVAPDGSLVGVSKVLFQDDEFYHTGIYHSRDKGLSFQRIESGDAYSSLDTKGMYQSIARLKNGRYLQVRLAEQLLVQASDDLIHWEDVGKIVAEEKYQDCNKMFHTSSIAEFIGADGKNRIFMPIAMSKRVMHPDTKLMTVMHDTVVFYSDDEGKHWTPSRNSTADVFEKVGHPELLSYAECKVVQCKDGSLRLYNSRNDTRFICYSESFDFGETWEGLHPIKELQCAKSSSAFCEDPTEPGTYYMAWVNDEPMIRGNCNGRTRISLARSCDGKNWRFLGDAEYMSLRFADDMPHLYIPLFQILDPSITVTEDYVYLTYGISMYSAKDAKPGDAKMVHHIQRPALTRFEKKSLKEQPWNASNICNPKLAYESEEDIL